LRKKLRSITVCFFLAKIQKKRKIKTKKFSGYASATTKKLAIDFMSAQQGDEENGEENGGTMSEYFVDKEAEEDVFFA
jgi:hypothetical protein